MLASIMRGVYLGDTLIYTPPRESINMAIFLENLETPILAPGDTDSPGSGWDCTAVGLRVRQENYQGEASTAALRGSFSSEQGESGSEGDVGCGEVEVDEVTMDKVEIFEDSRGQGENKHGHR